MKTRIFSLILASFFYVSCSSSSGDLPDISQDDLQKAQDIEEMMQEAIEKGDVIKALEEGVQPNEKGGFLSKILERLMRAILPNHLEDFNSSMLQLSTMDEPFADYRGVYGSCYQFRVFFPYEDTRVGGVKWASSVLSIPKRKSRQTQSAVVLAPTLDGFTPLIEAGLWLKLCRKGVATLMPESLYKQKDGGWEQMHFDPTPKYKHVEEYTLYQESISRYENILKTNIELLRNLNEMKTTQGPLMKDLTVMKVSPNRVGFWGSSFGAVVGSMVVAKDPKIKGAVLTVGGGNIPYIIAKSNIGLFKDTRKEQMKILGLKTAEEYEQFISWFITSDPLDFAKATDASRLHMILAKKDKSVPTKTQIQLWEKFGEPKHGSIRKSHVTTLLFLSWLNLSTSRKAMDSLVDKLSKEPLN